MTSQKSLTSWRRETDARGVNTLWFDQPGRPFNLLDRPAIDELDSFLDEIEADSASRGCILRSAKPGGFCAGIDLNSLVHCESAAGVENLLRCGLAVINRLATLSIPTVAIIHGACLGGGLELALACRRRVAVASASPLQAGLPEIHLGLVPAWGGITRLPRTIDREEALDLLLTGRSIGYLRARSLGLVDRLASEANPAEFLDSQAPPAVEIRRDTIESWSGILDRARERIDDQPGAFPEVQHRLLSIVEMDVERGPEAGQEAAVAAFAELAVSSEARESIAWFFQRKRIPSFY